jgi:histidyl-tRNA synthetase
LETHQLLPKSKKQTEVYICTVKSDYIPDATVIAKTLREQGVNTEVDITDKKLGDQMKFANKKGAPYVLCIGEDELKSGLFPLKNMETGEEKKVKIEEIKANIK